MVRKLFLAVVFVLFFLSIPTVFHVYKYSQSINVVENKVIYELPYPGLLPDNPLYFVKASRDKILGVVTRDPVKKAQLYLMISDKRINAATSLAQKGKSQLAISTASKAEKYALAIPELLQRAKTQGGTVDSAFVDRARTSNAKHRVVINDLLKTLPRGDQEDIKKVLDLNEDVRMQLQKI